VKAPDVNVPPIAAESFGGFRELPLAASGIERAGEQQDGGGHSLKNSGRKLVATYLATGMYTGFSDLEPPAGPVVEG
jgi:hypothetical protein